MKFKNPFKGWRRPSMPDVASAFNHAAILTLPVITGYSILGRFGAFFAAAYTAVGYFVPDHRTVEKFEKFVEEIRAAAIGIFDEDTEIGREIAEFTRNIGLEKDIEILVVNMDGAPQLAHLDAEHPSIIFIPLYIVENFPSDEIVAFIKHEIGHLMLGSNEKGIKLGEVSKRGGFINLGMGAAGSILGFNFYSFLIALCSALLGKALDMRNLRIEEYQVDDFVVRYHDPEVYARSLRRITGHKSRVLENALARFDEFVEILPEVIGNLVKKKKVPSFLLEAYMEAERFFASSHPKTYLRLVRIWKSVEGRDAELKLEDDVNILDEIDVCRDCFQVMGAGNEQNLSVFLKEEFESVFGYRDLKITFSNCGRPPAPYFLPMPFFFLHLQHEPFDDRSPDS